MTHDLGQLVEQLEGLDSNGRPSTDAEKAMALALVELVQINKRQLHYLAGIDRELNLSRTHKRFKFLRRKAK